MPRRGREILYLAASLAGLAAFIAAFRHTRLANPTTIALALLVFVLGVATRFALWVAVVTAGVAMLGLNFFFMDPVGTFTIADSRNWIALLAFLTAAVVVSQLSAAARSRTREAIDSRNELARLFDLSRDVLLTGEGGGGTLDSLARHIARRFELPRVAICLVEADGWHVHQGGRSDIQVDPTRLDLTLASAGRTLEFDAYQRTYGGGARVPDRSGAEVLLVPLRLGVHPIGLIAAPVETLAPGTLDAVAGLVAIAVERLHFLVERKEAEAVRQRADFTSALLASLSHDLRTPLTAIQVAVANLENDALPPEQRRAQTRLAHAELERLNRLFRDILDMARIRFGGHRAGARLGHRRRHRRRRDGEAADAAGRPDGRGPGGRRHGRARRSASDLGGPLIPD